MDAVLDLMSWHTEAAGDATEIPTLFLEHQSKSVRVGQNRFYAGRSNLVSARQVKIIGLDRCTGAEHHGSFNAVSELPDIPRPAVVEQCLLCSRTQLPGGASEAAGDAFYEETG